MTRRSITLNLPWPDAELSPNARVHWSRKARLVRQYREFCMVSTIAAVRHRWEGAYYTLDALEPPVTAEVTFVVPDRRRRDMDNALAAMKPAWDGLVDAGLLVDDSADKLRFAAPQMRYEKGKQYVEVELR